MDTLALMVVVILLLVRSASRNLLAEMKEKRQPDAVIPSDTDGEQDGSED